MRLNPAPESAVDVTLTVASGSTATLSTDPSAAGSASITFTGVTGAVAGDVFIQGRETGTTTLVAEAEGYETQSANVEVVPSGFYIETPSFSIAASASPATIRIRSAALRPDNLGVISVQGLRGGLAADAALLSASTHIGTVSSPVAFSQNQNQGDAQFTPLTSGDTTLSVTQPGGFSVPTGRSTEITATVTSAASSNRARFVLDCDLQGVIGVLTAEVEIVSETGITWGSGPNPEITGVIGTDTYSTVQAGQLVSPVARYVFTGRNDFAEFTEVNTFERFIVQWELETNGLTMIINPFGGTTRQFCLLRGSALL